MKKKKPGTLYVGLKMQCQFHFIMKYSPPLVEISPPIPFSYTNMHIYITHQQTEFVTGSHMCHTRVTRSSLISYPPNIPTFYRRNWDAEWLCFSLLHFNIYNPFFVNLFKLPILQDARCPVGKRRRLKIVQEEFRESWMKHIQLLASTTGLWSQTKDSKVSEHVPNCWVSQEHLKAQLASQSMKLTWPETSSERADNPHTGLKRKQEQNRED